MKREGLAGQPWYTDASVEPIDVWATLDMHDRGCASAIIKYVLRYTRKNGVEDLRKAAIFTRFMIERRTDPNVPPTMSHADIAVALSNEPEEVGEVITDLAILLADCGQDEVALLHGVLDNINTLIRKVDHDK